MAPSFFSDTMPKAANSAPTRSWHRVLRPNTEAKVPAKKSATKKSAAKKSAAKDLPPIESWLRRLRPK